MSETVHYRGKAIKIEGDAEITAKIILAEKGIVELKSYNDTYLEQLCDDDENYFYEPTRGELYALDYTEHDLDEEIISAKEAGKEGEIEFELRYYNGGAGFSECLEEAFAKLYSAK